MTQEKIFKSGRNVFEEAWAYPNEKAKGIMAFKLKEFRGVIKDFNRKSYGFSFDLIFFDIITYMEDPTLAPQEIYQKLYQLSGDQYFGRENRELEQLLREAMRVSCCRCPNGRN